MENDNPDFFGGDDNTQNPVSVARDWIARARSFGDCEVDAVHLATVDRDGIPNLRVVYIREFTDDGFVFYTHYNGRKGDELAMGSAAINYYFPKWQRQIRIRGRVSKVPPEQSDAYFLGRPAGSRIGAWMSKQSTPVHDRATMETEMAAIAPTQADKRPPHWGGYHIAPREIEFWAMGKYRIHNRFQWIKDGDAWRISRLYP